MDIPYAFFCKTYLTNLMKDLEQRFRSKINYSKLESWIKSLDLIIDVYPTLSDGHQSCNLFIDKLNTADDVELFLEKYFSNGIQSISAAIIVKNEERCIRRCLDSILPLFDEIVIVDTGSTDKTFEILKSVHEPKVKLYSIEWEYDFSKARNFALEKVTSHWVFFIDADEYFDSPVGDDLKSLLSMLSVFPDINSTAISPKIVNENEHCITNVKRIFKTGINMKYYGIVHEEVRIWKESNWETTKSISIDIPLMHDGYTNEVYINKKKRNRDFNLSKMMLGKEPNDPRWIYFYARDAYDLIPTEEMETLLVEAILIAPNSEIETNNLRSSEYSFALLSIWAEIVLREERLDKLSKIVACMESLSPQSSNVIYYRTLTKMLLIKLNRRGLLSDLMGYRKAPHSFVHGGYHSEGYHIDFLIGVLLFEDGKFEEALSYFDMLKDKFMPQEYMDYFNELVSACGKRYN